MALSWDLPLPFLGRIPAGSWVGRPLPSSQAADTTDSLARPASIRNDVFALHHFRRMVARASFRVGRPIFNIIQNNQQMSEIILPSSWRSSSFTTNEKIIVASSRISTTSQDTHQFLGWSPASSWVGRPLLA